MKKSAIKDAIIVQDNSDYEEQLRTYEEEKKKLKELKMKLHPKKRCKYCGEKPNEHHHCSGKKAYQKGFEDGTNKINKKGVKR